jgi:2-dehydro-3-deoxyphosphogluconate aldolase/(4S)-4-hydroxy-2-oxoglutarate aldolase
MHEVLEKIATIGLVPVIKVEEAKKAPGLGRALIAGGIPVAEITFRSSAAVDAIRALKSEVPGLIVGAGTVLDLAQATRALEAGASFIVSPGWDDSIVNFCLERGVPLLPGVSGPDGVMRGIAKGLEALKFFPAEAAGGLPMLDSLAGPFASMCFVPTGGIDSSNVGAWARRLNVLAIGGSWMAPLALVEAEDWIGIERLCRDAVSALHAFSIAHVGVNGESEAECRNAVALLGALFGLSGKDGTSSVMLEGLEVTKSPFPGAKGHIAIRCNNVERAVARLAVLGAKVMPGTEKMEKGRMKTVYLDRELLGFAIHLLRA